MPINEARKPSAGHGGICLTSLFLIAFERVERCTTMCVSVGTGVRRHSPSVQEEGATHASADAAESLLLVPSHDEGEQALPPSHNLRASESIPYRPSMSLPIEDSSSWPREGPVRVLQGGTWRRKNGPIACEAYVPFPSSTRPAPGECFAADAGRSKSRARRAGR